MRTPHDRLRVLEVAANVAPRYGGPTAAVLSYARALEHAGHDVRVVTTDQDGAHRLDVSLSGPVRYQGCTVEFHRAGIGSTHRPWAPGFLRAVARGVRWADVVHINSLYLPHTVAAYLACLRTGTPYVVRPHGTLEPTQRTSSMRQKALFDAVLGRRYLDGAAALHFTSPSEAENAADLVGTDRSYVVPIPVDVPEHAAAPDRSQRVLFLGRVTSKKRLDLLLDAWPDVAARHPAAVLTVAGPVDPDQVHLLERAARLPRVEYVGLVTGAAKDDVLRRAGVFVLPSENENFAIAVAEAMAYGVPVLTRPGVALGEQVKRRGAGVVDSIGTASSLAEHLDRLLGDPGARRTMGLAGRRYASSDLDEAAIGERLGEVLRAAVHAPAGAALTPRPRVTVLGAHGTSGPSMHRYTRLAIQAWRDAGAEPHAPASPHFLSRAVARPGAAKWLGYVEKFLLFAPTVRRSAAGAEIVHITDHSDAIWTLALPRDTRVVVTCHDLLAVRAALGEIPEHRPGVTGRLYQRLVRAGLSRADLVLAVSEATAADVRRIVGVPTRVVSNPLDPAFLSTEPTSVSLPEKYLLSVGGPGWRKRREYTIEVWRHLRRTEPFRDAKLLLVGADLTDAERSAAGADLGAIEVGTGLDDGGLVAAYRGAAAVLVLSRYEGFGWPIVEGQAAGAPVLCADIPVLREVGGDGATYLTEHPTDAWASVATRLTEVGLSAEARTNLERFSTTAFAVSIGAVLKRLAAEHHVDPQRVGPA